jgi:hypothetical protein
MPPAPRSSAGSRKRIKRPEWPVRPVGVERQQRNASDPFDEFPFFGNDEGRGADHPGSRSRGLALFWRRLNLGPGLFRFPGFELLE